MNKMAGLDSFSLTETDKLLNWVRKSVEDIMFEAYYIEVRSESFHLEVKRANSQTITVNLVLIK